MKNIIIDKSRPVLRERSRQATNPTHVHIAHCRGTANNIPSYFDRSRKNFQNSIHSIYFKSLVLLLLSMECILWDLFLVFFLLLLLFCIRCDSDWNVRQSCKLHSALYIIFCQTDNDEIWWPLIGHNLFTTFEYCECRLNVLGEYRWILIFYFSFESSMSHLSHIYALSLLIGIQYFVRQNASKRVFSLSRFYMLKKSINKKRICKMLEGQ